MKSVSSAYYRTFGVKTVALRFGNVYGPGSTHKSSVVAKFIKQAIGGEQCEIYGDGSQTRDFIYIDDLTEAVLKAAMYQEEPGQPGDLLPWGEVFQIATNKEHTVNEVARMLQTILNEKDGKGQRSEIRGQMSEGMSSCGTDEWMIRMNRMDP